MDNKPIIVALDFAEAEAALACAARLDPSECRLKVGKELFTAAGPQLVSALQARGFEVFLDLKFHDIPNTVAGACRAASRLGVWMLDVHASGGAAMMRAARDAVQGLARPPLLIGVTVLTSLDDMDLRQLGFTGSAEQNAVRLAVLARDCGLHGVVCSAQEAPAMRRAVGTDFILVTPGIRPEEAADDQSRVATPAEAVRLGSDYLVVGRPVTRAPDPAAALRSINENIRRKAT